MTNEDYVPFQDGMIFESQGYGKGAPKCEFCGKPAQHANCHGHRRDCPYYCGNNDPQETPVPGGVFCLLLFTVVYIFIKKIKK